MRISKTAAHEIAKKLTEKKQDQVIKLEEDFRRYVTDCYKAQVPKEISTLAGKYPAYFKKTNQLVLNGHGFSFTIILSMEPVISDAKGCYNPVVLLNEKIANKAKLLQNKYENADKKLDELRRQIEVTLVGLGTFSKIQQHLPEAVPFLPKSTSMELMVNFDVLRAEINKKTIAA